MHCFFYSLYTKMVQAEKNILDMNFAQKVCIFCIMSKRNNDSFCCSLNHIICFCKSRVMPRFVRGKILFLPLFCIHRRNRREGFNRGKVLLLKKLIISEDNNERTYTHIIIYTRTHTIFCIYVTHTLLGLCMYVCVCVCVL